MSKERNNFLDTIRINGKNFKFFSLKKAEKILDFHLKQLPFTYRILIENLIRQQFKDLKTLKKVVKRKSGTELFFFPSRVLMQDYTGVPAIADLASMRDKIAEKKKDPEMINPIVPVSLVIDHSIAVDSYSKKNSIDINVKNEFLKNNERYELLKWAQQSLQNFTLFPPGSGICHQINIEYISEIVSEKKKLLYFDSVVGTDSHTTMVNALSILGWGVGGIEAEAGMLGQPISMLIPEVIGFEVKSKMPEGTTATDLVLTVVKMLRDKGVVGKFVEFYGEGLKNLTLADRATIANMAPEYGATCGFFPIDEETLKYLEFSGRDKSTVQIVEEYAKAQGLWASNEIEFTDSLTLDMSTIVPTISGPKRPQDKVLLTDASDSFKQSFKEITNKEKFSSSKVNNTDFEI